MSRKLLTLALAFMSITATADWLTPEMLWQLGRVSDPQLSPDGSQVLYNIRTYDVPKNKGNSDIWLYDFKTKTTYPIAKDSSNESMARWSADGKTIYYLNDQGSSQVYSMNANGSDKKQITHVDGDINCYGISANGSMIWMGMDVHVDNLLGKDKYSDLPKSSAKIYDDLMMRHWDSWADGTYSHIFVAPLKNGEVKDKPLDILYGMRFDSPLKPDGDEAEIAWSDDGKTLAYTCKKLSGREYALSTNSDIYLFDVASGKTSNISEGLNGYDKAPAFSPDGKQSHGFPGLNLQMKQHNNVSTFMMLPQKAERMFHQISITMSIIRNLMVHHPEFISFLISRRQIRFSIMT
ncbi:MAG: PD40 domain-containing protein [Bacteroidetes bacterium]|nr:PD40 domain-containing protein [Bacteroidota bacterium]